MESVRVDKWLWAARFFKTRSLASNAVTGGKVHLNGERIKASKKVVLNDRLSIRRQDDEYTVIVQLLSDKRRSASVAQTLYEETQESLDARAMNQEARRLKYLANPSPGSRPDKRSRRLIHRFIQKGND